MFNPFFTMRFFDPTSCPCTSCGVESAVPVRDLLALTALCPKCGATFREIGLSMRRTMDEAATFFDAVVIILHIEQKLGIAVADETVEAIRPWSELTLQDLATAVDRSSAIPAATSSDHAVRLAVRAEFPNAPESLDFDVPLLEAVSPQRTYGGY